MQTTQVKTAYSARQARDQPPAIDLLHLPIIRTLLRRRSARIVFQAVLLAVAAVLVLHGLYGPNLAPKNLATLVAWVHYRGLLVLVLLLAGNFFCHACPFMLPRELARRLFRPIWNWPRWLRNKWLAVILFVAILFGYELFALWSLPAWTAWLIVGYFVAALVVDALFKHASFCKWVCPIGQFNFVASAMSPLEVKVRDTGVCSHCKTKECIRGTPSRVSESGGRFPLPLVSRGCELALFQPMKVGNTDCTFCMDCVRACPHDNIGVSSRQPGAELWAPSPRSGIGDPYTRKDLAALVLVFCFGALLNAFGMVSPVYRVQAWLSQVLGTTNRAPILGVLFAVCLIVEPVVLLGLAAWSARRLTGSQEGLVALATRYAYSLVPFGFAVWVAHYAFHFFTGVLTVIPVTQNAAAELGWNFLGKPAWTLTGMPPGSVYLLEVGFLGLGLIGSWIVALQLARQDYPEASRRAFLPWAILHSILFAAAIWLLAQPMEMRGTFLGG
jgi:polyferredoxin